MDTVSPEKIKKELKSRELSVDDLRNYLTGVMVEMIRKEWSDEEIFQCLKSGLYDYLSEPDDKFLKSVGSIYRDWLKGDLIDLVDNWKLKILEEELEQYTFHLTVPESSYNYKVISRYQLTDTIMILETESELLWVASDLPEFCSNEPTLEAKGYVNKYVGKIVLDKDDDIIILKPIDPSLVPELEYLSKSDFLSCIYSLPKWDKTKLFLTDNIRLCKSGRVSKNKKLKKIQREG